MEVWPEGYCQDPRAIAAVRRSLERGATRTPGHDPFQGPLEAFCKVIKLMLSYFPWLHI